MLLDETTSQAAPQFLEAVAVDEDLPVDDPSGDLSMAAIVTPPPATTMPADGSSTTTGVT